MENKQEWLIWCKVVRKSQGFKAPFSHQFVNLACGSTFLFGLILLQYTMKTTYRKLNPAYFWLSSKEKESCVNVLDSLSIVVHRWTSLVCASLVSGQLAMHPCGKRDASETSWCVKAVCKNHILITALKPCVGSNRRDAHSQPQRANAKRNRNLKFILDMKTHVGS